MYEIRLLEEERIDELIGFLTRVFDMSADRRSVQPAMLHWKNWEPHPFWPGTRSFAAWHEGRMVAHGCLLPFRYRHTQGEVSAHVIIDWAADPGIPGGGVLIYQHCAKLTDIQIGIGGSDAAQKLVPRMRFQTRQTVGTYTRLQNPLKAQPEGPIDWKTPLRIGRDVLRQVKQGALTDTGSLSARRVAAFDESTPMPEPQGNIVSVRTPAFLNYALSCPAAEMEAYVLEDAATAVGYCLLARVDNQCRIADLWITGSRWNEAVALAARMAAQKSCGSIAINASTTALRQALVRQGFRVLAEWPLFVKDPGRKLPADIEVHISMLDNDAFFI